RSTVVSVLDVTLSLNGRGKGEGDSRSRLIAVLLSVFLIATGFTYQLALPGRKLTFPADHYSHPDFKTEWWYYTGHLETESGKKYGYKVTFFRFGVRDRQTESKDPPLFTELYMAQFAVCAIAATKFIYLEQINRGIA